ncbi:S9 family peptidase [Undibacterium sp. RuTC16W]|uniref:S9 family peptidase n=1 Tax=Undibacterium sp. RuTC16W TaxID=3413048 RepID=UPI003BF396EA
MIMTETTLIPRATLFGNPERAGCDISPCGRWLGFVAPLDGVMNLWVCECGDDLQQSLTNARPITKDNRRGIYSFSWAYDGIHLLYHQDSNGDENDHLFAVTVSGGAARDLTPFDGAKAELQKISRKQRDAVLVTINQRDPRFSDLFRVELDSGKLTLVRENPGFFAFITDDDYQVRLAFSPQNDGGRALLRPDGDSWQPWWTITDEDSANSWPQALSTDGKTMYMVDSQGRDTAALVSCELDDPVAVPTVIAVHPKADITGMWPDNDSNRPLAWIATYERREIHLLDDSLRADVAFLDSQGLGEWTMTSRTEDDKLWLVGAYTDRSPSSFYFYKRAQKKLIKLYDVRPALRGAPLTRMQHTTIETRDGLDMTSYLSLPVHADHIDTPLTSTTPLPLVLLVHGGPHARDNWGYNSEHQWLANRGYAVLSVNFRASTGFGKAFVAAGDGQWGARMDDDLVDAARWAIAKGIADEQRICIMGASYGGYATLWGMSAHPELYACGVDIVGPSNLETLVESIPPYWEAAKSQLFRMLGDGDTKVGRKLMKERSPVYHAAQIAKPLLIGQGANDPRVKQAESDQMVAAMKHNGVPVTYVLYPDEGHGFQRPSNSISFKAITEQFLAKFLGGRCEPLSVGEVEGSTAVMVENGHQSEE